MNGITLEKARIIIGGAFSKAGDAGLKPLAVVVLDAGGHTTAFERQDGASAMRYKIAHGKAYGAIAMGLGSRALYERVQNQAYFLDAMNALADGALVPVPGGVLIRDAKGALLGAVGVTGDNSDNDEMCAIAGIEAAGLAADTG
ncbi:MAG: GlcG/HbpS family heme-binding protein [Alphaproteobacteria bacterium]